MEPLEKDLPILDLVLVDLARSGPALMALEEDEPRLPEADRLQFSNASNARLAGRRRAAHIALRLLLEHYTGPEPVRQVAFHRGEHGRPSLPFIDPAGGTDSAIGAADTSARMRDRTGLDLHFSISYSGEEALIALARHGPVGVDLERPRTIRLSPARRARIEAAARALLAECGTKPTAQSGNLEDRQQTVVTAAAAAEPEAEPTAPVLRTGLTLEPHQAAFLRAWTRLEALAKATGLGVVRLFSQFDLLGPDKLWTPDHDAGVRDFIAGTGLAVTDLSLGSHRFAALAGPRATHAWSGNDLQKTVAGLVREFPADRPSLRAIASRDLAPSHLPPIIPR